MNAVTLFAAGTAATLLCSIAVVAFLRSSLREVLVDLRGTEERAEFWTAFSIVTLLLVPLIAAMFVPPDANAAGGSALLAVASQVRWALIGLVVAVAVLGSVISQFIPERPGDSEAVGSRRPVRD